ncbi:MAG: hypothetical protein EOO93_06410 [Pedobacter sp.]|nr:MAG: hypothetical protein EOO93_06410 [Pedobacter sp.]
MKKRERNRACHLKLNRVFRFQSIQIIKRALNGMTNMLGVIWDEDERKNKHRPGMGQRKKLYLFVLLVHTRID